MKKLYPSLAVLRSAVGPTGAHRVVDARAGMATIYANDKTAPPAPAAITCSDKDAKVSEAKDLA